MACKDGFVRRVIADILSDEWWNNNMKGVSDVATDSGSNARGDRPTDGGPADTGASTDAAPIDDATRG